MKKPNWIIWPHREYQQQIDDLYRMGAICDAWRRFMQSGTLKALKRVKGYFGWFNRYDYFNSLYVEFEVSEKALRKAITSLLLPEHKDKAYEFRRIDIYDARAWAILPLNWFVETDLREVPSLHLGIKLPLVVERSNFHLSHRLKDGGRFAVMTFNADFLDRRFEGKRWVAEHMFPREATRAEMQANLFQVVERECAKCMVTIREESDAGNTRGKRSASDSGSSEPVAG